MVQRMKNLSKFAKTQLQAAMAYIRGEQHNSPTFTNNRRYGLAYKAP